MANNLHNLSLASATHLHAQGHITRGMRDQIHAKVRRMKMPKGGATQQPFGSLAPGMSAPPVPAPGPAPTMPPMPDMASM